MDSLLVGLAALLCFLFGWNNSSFLIGNLRGAGSLSFVATLSISVLGLVAGVLLEGSKMVHTLSGSLSSSTTSAVLLAVMAVSLMFTFGLTLLDLPVSFSMIMVSAFLGATYSLSLPINIGRSEAVVAFWFAAPVATGVVTYVVYELLTRFASQFSILTVDSLNRAGSVVSGLAVAYVLGANNIGLIYGSTVVSPSSGQVDLEVILLLVLAGILGMVTLGRSALGGVMGDRMLTLSPQGVFAAFVSSALVVWVGTQYGLPVSISQCLLGGMIGAALSRSISAVNVRLVSETLSLWVVAPVVAFALSGLLVGLL
jgi:phosphate/sulfate permease